MVDILSLSPLDLRKEVAKAKGYEVKTVPMSGAFVDHRYSLQVKGVEVASTYLGAEDAWSCAPPLDLAHTFPLALEMRSWGWGVYLETRPGIPLTVIIEAETDDAIRKAGCRYYEVGSDSNTDPGDAIAKAYLLVRREMGV